MRKTAAIILAAAFVVVLAGCSDLPQTVDSCTPAAAGSASKSITAHGKFGHNPDAKVPTPTTSSTVQESVLRKGNGPVLGKDDIAKIQWTVYLGTSGQAIGSSGANGFSKSTEVQATVGAKADPWGHYLSCQRVGSRTATVLTAKQLLGSAAAAQQNGLTSKDALVVVTDIESGYRGRATGALQPLKSGFPSVVTAPDGTPGVTLDLQTPPKTLRYEVIRGGTGATVKKGDSLLLQVEGIEWTTNPAPTDTFVSTWTSHVPQTTVAASVTQNSKSTLDPGSAKALIGQKVGSQVLVVVPPKYGYPSGKAPQGYPTGGTLVFIYDILGIQ